MELQTTLQIVSDVALGIVLLYIILSLRALDSKIKELEGKGKDLSDVIIKMWELSRTEEGRQFAADMLISYNRRRDQDFNSAAASARDHLATRKKKQQTGEEEQE